MIPIILFWRELFLIKELLNYKKSHFVPQRKFLCQIVNTLRLHRLRINKSGIFWPFRLWNKHNSEALWNTHILAWSAVYSMGMDKAVKIQTVRTKYGCMATLLMMYLIFYKIWMTDISKLNEIYLVPIVIY